MDTEEFGANPPPPCAELQSYHGHNISGTVDTYIILLMEDILHPLIGSLSILSRYYRVSYIPGDVVFLPSTVCTSIYINNSSQSPDDYIYSRKRTVNHSKRHRVPPAPPKRNCLPTIFRISSWLLMDEIRLSASCQITIPHPLRRVSTIPSWFARFSNQQYHSKKQ